MDKIEVQSITSPGSTRRLDAGKYHAMKRAVLAVLPAAAPGITVAEMQGGVRAGWWAKAVQLDLEARGVIARATTKPLRLHQIKED